MTTDDVLTVEVADGIATVTLDRPEARNALNRALRRRLREAIAALDVDDAVDVIVLTGADPAFCAGLDLGELSERRPDDAGPDDTGPDDTGPDDAGPDDAAGSGARAGDDPPARGPLPPCSKLLIGAVNGVAVTGGFELALACDFLVASERARFADTHARVGIMPGWGLTVRLVERIGPARAKELSVTGNFLDAATARDWGLVNHVVPHDELLGFARKLAADCRTIDQQAVRRMLRTYDEVAATTAQQGWDVEARAAAAWMRERFDPAAVAERRAAIEARGRSQR